MLYSIKDILKTIWTYDRPFGRSAANCNMGILQMLQDKVLPIIIDEPST